MGANFTCFFSCSFISSRRSTSSRVHQLNVPPIACTIINPDDETRVPLPITAKLQYYVKPNGMDTVKLGSPHYYVCPQLKLDRDGILHEASAGRWTDIPPPIISETPKHTKDKIYDLSNRSVLDSSYARRQYYQGRGIHEKLGGFCGLCLDSMSKYILRWCGCI